MYFLYLQYLCFFIVTLLPLQTNSNVKQNVTVKPAVSYTFNLFVLS